MESEDNSIKLNVRSEEIEAILGKTPNWLMRTGITVMFVIFLVLLIGSSMFRYPDIVNAKIVISTEYPSIALVSKVGGRLVNLDIKDKDLVTVNLLLAIQESASSAKDMLQLNAWINNNSQPELISLVDTIFSKEQQLGEVMPYFLDLKMALVNYSKFVELNYHAQNKRILEEQIEYMNNYVIHAKNQIDLFDNEMKLARNDYLRDSSLHEKQIISPMEMEQSKSVLLQKRISQEGNMASLANIKTQLSQLKQNLLELELDYRKQQQDYLTDIRQKLEALRDRTEQWDKMYVLRSPYAGQISFPTFWTENQYISQGETFANIMPSSGGLFIGKLELPVLKSGKVKTGQLVNIKLDNYPYMEYGILKGAIRTISAIPNKDTYKVEVQFLDGMKTSYGIDLPFSPEITGTAEIITEDYSILQRIIFPIKSLIKNNGPAFFNKTDRLESYFHHTI